MSKKHKGVPKLATARAIEKTARIADVPFSYYPSWRFSTVDKNGPFAWPRGTDTELKIVGRLHDFDSMKWTEIEGPDHHLLSAGSLSKEAVERLREIKQEDEIDSMFSFHLHGEPRIICIRDRGIARLLWFDPEHGVCPVNKK
jgi:hypothetical protein